VKSSDNDSSSTVQTSSAEKKSSFATDVWLAQQRDAGHKVEVQLSEQDKMSSQDLGHLPSETAKQPESYKHQSRSRSPLNDAKSKVQTRDSRTYHRSQSPSVHPRQLSAETVKQPESYKHRRRSRSPLNDAQSKVRVHDNRMYRRSQSPSVHPRQLEERRECQSTRTNERQSMYTSEQESSSRHSSSYDREPFASSSSVRELPLKSALRKPTNSVEQKPASVQLYSATYGREQDVSCNAQQCPPMDRNAYYSSQMRNVSQ